jgi:Family of unknown function (DUF6188)
VGTPQGMVYDIPIDLVEDSDRWVLPLSGCTVGQCCVDWAVTLRLDHPRGAFELCIEDSFLFTPLSYAPVRLQPENDPTGLGLLLTVTRTTVEHAAAFRDGRLEMSFADGSSLTVSGSQEHEPWALVGPDGLRVVSVPGGELAIWRPLA